MPTSTSKSHPNPESLSAWDKIALHQEKYSDLAYPKVSIVIPTHNCSQLMSTTLESVLDQDYPDFELIIIDATSCDRTLEVIRSYPQENIRIYSVSQYGRYEMLNKGIAHANGLYINFLFPGDFYIHYQSIRYMMELSLQHNKPHLLYGGCVLHGTSTEVKILNRPLTLKLIKTGRQPTNLQSCWFRADTFRKIGKFPTDYSMRGGFDLLTRFMQHDNLRVVSTSRVLTDYDLRGIGQEQVIQHFLETLKSLKHRFGTMTMLRWLFFEQTDTRRYFQHWKNGVKVALFGRQ